MQTLAISLIVLKEAAFLAVLWWISRKWQKAQTDALHMGAIVAETIKKSEGIIDRRLREALGVDVDDDMVAAAQVLNETAGRNIDKCQAWEQAMMTAIAADHPSEVAFRIEELKVALLQAERQLDILRRPGAVVMAKEDLDHLLAETAREERRRVVAENLEDKG